MIFVTVGTQFPFDRLVRCVDEWADRHKIEVVAQIGDGKYQPIHARWESFMNTDVFMQTLQAADLIISHAGMGNIITALDNEKPIIVMNRQSELGEHRNNHQGEGLAWMARLPGLYTARTCTELLQLLDNRENLHSASQVATEQRQQLIDFLNRAIRV